jgi:uncharacterized protein DUF4038
MPGARLNGRGGYCRTSVLNVPTPPATPQLLLAASSNNRYLVDGNGDPFLLWGTAAWNSVNENLAIDTAGTGGHTFRSYQTRLATDASQGCTATLIQLVSRYQTNAPNNANNTAPFTTPGDFATFNSTYFSFAKQVIDYAATLNMICVVAPLWMGYDDTQGWYTDMVANGATKCGNYGAAVAGILGSCDNIIWCGAGDRPGGGTPHSTTEMQALINGIRSVSSRHLWTHHWNFEASDVYTLSPTNVLGCYSWSDIGGQVATEYAKNTGPCVMLEALYEDNTSFGYTSEIGRRQTMETMLEGGKGVFWGNEATWHCGAADTNLPSQSQGKPYLLSTVDTLEFRNCKSLFTGRDWHLLVPSTGTGKLLTGGDGTAALTPDGTYGVIYSKSAGQTIDKSKMSGAFTIKIFDITNNTFTVHSTANTASGSLTITPTTFMGGNNTRGATDYAILLTVP